ncbi:hypothetical protein [Pseudoroseicyclus sp. CXY001]|uniref:hypothetical protein n=1 Tax=Pseudoroseicyclus sp. CXY001 TaxID=3242492 RepID=UPI003570BBCA
MTLQIAEFSPLSDMAEPLSTYRRLAAARADAAAKVLPLLASAEWGDILDFYKGEGLPAGAGDILILEAIIDRRECGLGVALDILEGLHLSGGAGQREWALMEELVHRLQAGLYTVTLWDLPIRPGATLRLNERLVAISPHLRLPRQLVQLAEGAAHAGARAVDSNHVAPRSFRLELEGNAGEHPLVTVGRRLRRLLGRVIG